MMAVTTRYLFRIALVLALAGAAPAALAQNFSVAAPASVPGGPLANAATQQVASSVYFDVSNSRAGTTINRVEFTFQKRWPATGGSGPAGWALVGVSEHANNVTLSFEVATCGQGGLMNGGPPGTFRLDFTPSTTWQVDRLGPTAETFDSIAPSDPCGGSAGWATLYNAQVIPVRMLQLTASASPLAGTPPLTTTVTLAVTNRATAQRTVVAPTTSTVTPATGYTFNGCSPGSLTLAANNGTGNFTCGYTFNPASSASYTVAMAVSSNPPGSSSVDAVAGPILVGSANASFAFDQLNAAQGDVVRATLMVTNQTGATATITPPTFAQLSLTGLARATGTTDPVPATGVLNGESHSFVYVLNVMGALGASYVASGTASVGAGTTNVAVTPAGTVSAFMTTWDPTARKTGAPGPYEFTVTVTNLSSTAIAEIEIVNPQNTAFTGIANVSMSGMTSVTKRTNSPSGTDALSYTGALAQNATATLMFGFTGVPAVTNTTTYPFQVIVYGRVSGGGTTIFPIGTHNASVTITVPLPDVANLSVLSSPTGQTLYWTNTSDGNGTHDGVVIFKSAAKDVPQMPKDGQDYTGDPSVFYFDRFASSVSSIVDPQAGAYNYRVCNHDAAFIYSLCTMSTWKGAVGYIDSVALPSGVSWAHSLGIRIDAYPGAWQHRIAVASNAPSMAVLDAPTGQRFFVTGLKGFPIVGTPAVPVNNGAATLAFGADSSGRIFAIDLTNGASPPGWNASVSTEGFIGGIAAVLQQYVNSAYRSNYTTDVLLLGSSITGNLLGIDARTGATLWTKPPATSGATVSTQPVYDYATNRLYVAYGNGGGVVAYGGIGSASAPGTPLWTNPGAYVTPCTFGNGTGQLACIDTTGNLHVFDGTNGADLLGTSGYPTGVASALSLWRAGDGYVVSNASTIVRVVMSGSSVTSTYTYSGTTLSPVLVSVGSGFVYVGASDLNIHKLYLSNLGDTGQSRQVVVAGGGPPPLAIPMIDVIDNLLLFGSSDGRLWAVPVF